VLERFSFTKAITFHTVEDLRYIFCRLIHACHKRIRKKGRRKGLSCFPFTQRLIIHRRNGIRCFFCRSFPLHGNCDDNRNNDDYGKRYDNGRFGGFPFFRLFFPGIVFVGFVLFGHRSSPPFLTAGMSGYYSKRCPESTPRTAERFPHSSAEEFRLLIPLFPVRHPCQWEPATNPLQSSRFAGKRIFHGKHTGDYPVKWHRIFSNHVPSGLSRTAIGSGNLLIFLPLRDPHDLTVLA